MLPLCKYTILPATVKVVGTFLKAILWKTFQLVRRILSGASIITKASSLQCWFQSRKRKKSAGVWSGDYGGCSNVVIFFIAKKSLTNTERCAGALSWRKNKLMVLHFFWGGGAFSSDVIPKATDDVNVHLFIHCSNYCNYINELTCRHRASSI